MLRFLFSPYGRISRKTYWLNWILPYFLLSFVAAALDNATFPVNPATGEPPPLFQGILGLILLWPSLAVTAKRLHDRGMTGWWQGAQMIAIAALAVASYAYYTAKMNANGATNLAVIDPNVATVLAVVFGAVVAWLFLYPLINALFLRGQSGPNKYGNDPLQPSIGDTFA